MSWSVGYDTKWKRDIGYGVPAICDHPECDNEIHRGLSYVCGGEPFGGDHGCGVYFCQEHLTYHEIEDDRVQCCERCAAGENWFNAKPDTPEWIRWKLTDESWQEWRDESPELVAALMEGGDQ